MKLAIASGKGGTGKTTLAVNLALYAAATRRVALLDLDVEEPNSGIFLKGMLKREKPLFRAVPEWKQEACVLCGKCSELCRFNAVLKLGKHILVMTELCHSCYACSELCPENALPMTQKSLGFLRHYEQDGLDFVESKMEIGVEMATPLIEQTLAYAEAEIAGADLQIRDCPPGTSCSVINATRDADFALLVTEPTPFGLHDLSLAVETMRHLDKPIAVAVNRVGIGNDDVFRYCEAEGIPVWASFPHDRRVAELYSRGETLYDKVDSIRTGLDAILAQISGIGGGK